MAAITTSDTNLQYATVIDTSSVGQTQNSSQTVSTGNLSNDYSTLENYAQNSDVNDNEFSQPAIDEPTTSTYSTYSSSTSSATDLEAGQYALMQLFNTLNDAMMKNFQLEISNGITDRKNAADQIIKKLNDAIHKMEKARKKAHHRSILSTITDVFTCIGAALAVAGAAALSTATGGAAAPLLAITSLMLIQTVASVISKHAGGPDMSISNGLTSLSVEILKGCGMSDEEAKKFAPFMALGLTLTFMIATAASGVNIAAITPLLTSPEIFGNAATSIAKESGASEEEAMYIGMAITFVCTLVGAVLIGAQAGKMSQLAVEGKSMAFAAKMGLNASRAGIVVGMAGSVTTIGSSSLDISIAEDEKSAAYAQADAHEITALAQKIMQAIQDSKDDIENLMSQYTAIMDSLSTTVKERSAITEGLISRMA